MPTLLCTRCRPAPGPAASGGEEVNLNLLGTLYLLHDTKYRGTLCPLSTVATNHDDCTSFLHCRYPCTDPVRLASVSTARMCA